MKITGKQLETLKKGSVSVDSGKSSERILGAFKNASKEQKAEIVKLSGLSISTIYRASASPKLVLALTSVLNISPYYFTSESDDTNCNDDVIGGFYKKYAGDEKKKAKKEKSAKPAEKKAAAKPVDVKTEKIAIPVVKTEKKAIPTIIAEKLPNIDDESLVSLLRALSIRAKFGGEAEATYNAVVALLIK